MTAAAKADLLALEARPLRVPSGSLSLSLPAALFQTIARPQLGEILRTRFIEEGKEDGKERRKLRSGGGVGGGDFVV